MRGCLTKVAAPVVGATKLRHIEGAAKAAELAYLTAGRNGVYLEEPYVPHNLVGVMAQNTPAAARETARVVGRQSKNLKGATGKWICIKTDPEFAERFEYFAFDEVVNEEGQQLDEITRYMAISAALIGCRRRGRIQAKCCPERLDDGVTPIVAKEIVYQATDYLGYGRMLPFLSVTNEMFAESGHRASA